MVVLTDVGQIKVNDSVFCEFEGKKQKYRAKEVLNAGTEEEEVLLNKKKNLYFITRMAIDGSSWAKNVSFVSS